MLKWTNDIGFILKNVLIVAGEVLVGQIKKIANGVLSAIVVSVGLFMILRQKKQDRKRDRGVADGRGL